MILLLISITFPMYAGFSLKSRELVLVEAIFAYLHVGIEPEDIADGKICPITPIPRVLVST
jgi:hypothetical protein